MVVYFIIIIILPRPPKPVARDQTPARGSSSSSSSSGAARENQNHRNENEDEEEDAELAALSAEEREQLLEENTNLQSEFELLMDEVKRAESQMAEISHISSILSAKILDQEKV